MLATHMRDFPLQCLNGHVDGGGTEMVLLVDVCTTLQQQTYHVLVERTCGDRRRRFMSVYNFSRKDMRGKCEGDSKLTVRMTYQQL